VLLKERNLLHTERMAARTAREKFINPGRLAKVRKAMARLKHVLTERAIAEHAGDEDALQAAKDRINQL
jgi:large subunit ribosomal protein L47